MREHLNYFTVDALVAVLSNSGFAVDVCGINLAGQIFAIARKSATGSHSASAMGCHVPPAAG